MVKRRMVTRDLGISVEVKTGRAHGGRGGVRKGPDGEWSRRSDVSTDGRVNINPGSVGVSYTSNCSVLAFFTERIAILTSLPNFLLNKTY